MKISAHLCSALITLFTVAACGGGGGGGGGGNTAPTVNAGADQSVNEGQTVNLSGATVTDPDDTPSLSWTQVSGQTVSLSNSTTLNPSFPAPSVSTTQVVVLRLTANDGTNDPVSDDISITINNVNTPPVVEAGVAQTVTEGETVSLNATATDDGSTTLEWTLVSGPDVSLSNGAAEDPTFVAPAVDEDTVITLRLTADDGVNAPVSDTVQITVQPINLPPEVNAGPDQTVDERATVTLAGVVTDDRTSATLSWSQVSGPAITLSATNVAAPTFTAPSTDTNASIVLRLSATDGVNAAVTDDVTINVTADNNLSPVVEAGNSISVASGAEVTLDGAASDPEMQALTLLWTQSSGTPVTLSATDVAAPTFTAPTVQSRTSLVFQLSADDGNNDPVTDSVTITVNPPVPVTTVTRASDLRDDRLACYQGNGEAACNLRIYQIMVEAFIDADGSANALQAYGNSHHRGDIAGITASLDYIQSIGMNAIWLTPIFYSDGADNRLDGTGYYATDYFRIDPKFGTLEQARTMVDEAHARGLYVFFDGVFGHYLTNVEASPNGLTPNISGAQGDQATADYPDDLAFFQEVAAYWVRELKIDGWRLDKADEVGTQGLANWYAIRQAVETASAEVTYTNSEGQTVNPLGHMFAEVLVGSASTITSQALGQTDTSGLRSAFDFPMYFKVMDTFAVQASFSGNLNDVGRDASYLHTSIKAEHAAFPAHAMPNLILGNHDIPRFGDLLQRGAIANPTDDEYWSRHKIAMAYQSAYSGPITRYYNEEIGAELASFSTRIADNVCDAQNRCDDNVARTSARIEGIPPQVGQAATVLTEREADLKDYHTQLMEMRAAHPALYNGARTHIYSDMDVYIDHKEAGDDVVLYLTNLSGEDLVVRVRNTAIGSAGDIVDLLDDEVIMMDGDNNYEIFLPALSARFFDIVTPNETGPQTNTGSLTGDGPLAACDTPDDGGSGPITDPVFIRGTYTGGNNFAATPASRQFTYKGSNIYQVVVSETVGSFSFKFAAADWSPEFAVENAQSVDIGQMQTMVTASGQNTESSILIPQAGDYVYSFQVNETLTGGDMMVSLCP